MSIRISNFWTLTPRWMEWNFCDPMIPDLDAGWNFIPSVMEVLSGEMFDFGHWWDVCFFLANTQGIRKNSYYTKQYFEGICPRWFKVTFSGWLSDPFKGLSDLQLGDEKVLWITWPLVFYTFFVHSHPTPRCKVFTRGMDFKPCYKNLDFL